MNRPLIESIDRRVLLSGAAIDPTWHLSQADVDRAVGSPTAITDVLVGPNGRTYLLGIGDARRSGPTKSTYIVALGPDGRPDPKFGARGAVATPFTTSYYYSFSPGATGITPVVGADDALYLIGGERAMVRYRPNGARDKTWGEGGVLRLPAGVSGDLHPDGTGRFVATFSSGRQVGVDVVRTNGVEPVYRTTISPPDSDYGPKLAGARLVATDNGFEFLFGEQFYDQHYVEPVDPSPGQTGYREVLGMIHAVHLEAASFTPSRSIQFDTGTYVGLGDVFAYHRGIRLVANSGDLADHRRVVDLRSDGTIVRSFVNTPAGKLNLYDTELLADGSVLQGGLAAVTKKTNAPAIRHLNADGKPDPNFGIDGTLAVAQADERHVFGITQLDTASDGSILATGSVLIGRDADNYWSRHIQRVLPPGGPTATLLGIRGPAKSGRFAFVTVRYAATSGIVRKTINRSDLAVYSGDGPAAVTVLGAIEEPDGSVIAQYRFDCSRGGAFGVAVAGGQVSAGDGTVTRTRTLARFTTDSTNGPTVRNARVTPLGAQYVISVNYSASAGVSLGSIKATPLIVRGPNGVRFEASYEGSQVAVRDGIPYPAGGINVRYRVPYANGYWPSDSDGVYTAVLPASTIADGFGVRNPDNRRVIAWTAHPTADLDRTLVVP